MKKKILCFLLSLIIYCPLAVYAADMKGAIMNQDNIFRTISGSKNYRDVVKWGNSVAVLTNDRHSIRYTLLGNVWTDVNLEYFAESDIPVEYGTVFAINDIEVLGDQLIAGCDGGIVLIITDCHKCYKLKKIGEFDIDKISFNAAHMIAYAKKADVNVQIPIDEIRQSKIDPTEVRERLINGGYLIDVRDKADYDNGHIDGAVNIPIDEIEKIDKYPKDTVLIFCCYRGSRAEKAVEAARGLGFINVYNAGGFEELNIVY